MLENLQGSSLNRRSFLRGSAMFAAAVGLAVVPAFAQQEQKPKPEEGEKREDPKDPFGDDKKNDNKLIDAEGREYRVCPQCGNNMYKQGRMWVCENCGYSYVE